MKILTPIFYIFISIFLLSFDRKIYAEVNKFDEGLIQMEMLMSGIKRLNKLPDSPRLRSWGFGLTAFIIPLTEGVSIE